MNTKTKRRSAPSTNSPYALNEKAGKFSRVEASNSRPPVAPTRGTDRNPGEEDSESSGANNGSNQTLQGEVETESTPLVATGDSSGEYMRMGGIRRGTTRAGSSRVQLRAASTSVEQRTRRRNSSTPFELPGSTLPANDNNETRDGVEGRTVTISVDTLNEMKSDIATLRRATNELCSSIEVWKERCGAYKEQAERAKVNMEYMAQSPSTSASKTSSCVTTPPCGKKVSVLKTNLFKELAARNIPFVLTQHFSLLFDDMTKYAHLYTLEMCSSSSSAMHSSLPWQPNEVINEERFIRDWRGRIVMVDDFKERVVDNEEDMSFLGAPLFEISDASDELPEGKSLVKKAFLPICPHEEAARGTMFSSSREMMENFIGQCVLSIMNSSMMIPPSDDSQSLAFRLAAESSVLKKRFDVVCRQVISVRKKQTKDIYFSTLGYTSLSFPRSRVVQEGNGATRVEEEREAYSRLHRLNSDGTRDTSFWRMGVFEEICCPASSQAPMELSETGGPDVLFRNEPARLTYKQFRKYPISDGDECSIMSIVRLDALMTSVIDTLEETSNPCPPASERPSGTEFASKPTNTINAKRGVKGGVIPLDVIRRFRSLLPLAASQLHSFILNEIKDVADESGIAPEWEFKVKLHGSVDARLANDKRQFTIAFRYPPNGRYYIALTQTAFRSYICGWVGSVNDCIILQSASLETSFMMFVGQQSFRVVESDEELPPQGAMQEGRRHPVLYESEDLSRGHRFNQEEADDDEFF